MSHMVKHTTADGTQYQQFDDLGAAVKFVEDQRNAGVEDTVLYELREIPLEVKSYFKVEIAEAAETTEAAPETPAPAAAPVAEAAPEAPAPEAPAVETVAPAEVVEPPAPTPMDDVSYVEAAMASPIDAFATEAPPLSEMPIPDQVETPAPTEGRRGLFGR